MEMQAQYYVRNCNANGGSLGNYAGNIAKFNGNVNPREALRLTLNMWWSRGRQVVYGSNNNHHSTIGNMLNARTNQIGCAYKRCETTTQLLCLYSSKKQEPAPVVRPISSSTSQLKPEVNNADVQPLSESRGSKSCNTYGMTEAIRNRILDVHNELRSLTAKGWAENKTGYAPPAARMYKLKYDCSLEKMAASHARKCEYKHSSQDPRRRVGENIYKVWPPTTGKEVETAEHAARFWFHELKQYGVYMDNRFTREMVYRPGTKIGHYTQMVWDKTKYLGCAVQNCPTETLVVCNYKEAGNYWDELIYKTGYPCSECPVGSKCNAEKLCVFES